MVQGTFKGPGNSRVLDALLLNLSIILTTIISENID